MDSEKLKLQIGANISALRRQRGMTQAELAERLNYTDKAVSKWERGDSIPDAVTLVQLAGEFGVTLDELVTGDKPAVAEPAPQPRKQKANKSVILTLASLLVWIVALTVYVVLSSVGVPKSWVSFIYAVPVNAIVLLSMRSAFRRFGWNHALVSIIVWGCLVSLYVTLYVFAGVSIWRIIFVGILGQVAVSLWFQMFRAPREGSHDEAGA